MILTTAIPIIISVVIYKILGIRGISGIYEHKTSDNRVSVQHRPPFELELTELELATILYRQDFKTEEFVFCVVVDTKLKVSIVDVL